ncbi:guanylate kinase [Ureaplasma miroungigenitalium]|uniref:Guanylate kinase n=1 Tax=Ureaplasma miroungigenitalium TaxID=1042321 RepID=A0ABT3BLZ0_9BACT|nr:guanylate kinase [Ureaplasma miroungigenitalium]MCV3728268.1 guanylate kinase [Ureaplasma miroungigenitalium]MCV3734073.1 guanylate kinase [Ureaplasma miroungigenitalium]
MHKGKIIVFSGPSGVGKKTILDQIFNKQSLNLTYSISMTTRAQRPGEVNGVDYYFVSPEDFNQAIANNELIEWAEFVNNRYGTLKKEVERLRNDGKNVLLEIEVVGALQVLELFKNDDLLSIFILPPSLKELERRLLFRNTETREVINQRLQKAEKEMAIKHIYQYNIINDDPKNAAHTLEAILKKELRF